MARLRRGILLTNGYKEYEPNKFQKKITDIKGTRYFINVTKYVFPAPLFESYDFSVQFETKHGAVNVTTVQWFNNGGVYSGNTLKDVERYFIKMWAAHGKQYYELYGD